MPELEPITRAEKFLNGEVGMTPITREEKILAGEDIETVTRREYFLKKYRGGGGGDITVEEITITENGTTTAPSGKAYSPIHTNVPLPQNAYLLKSVPNLPQPIASFNDGADAPIKSLKVAIEPQQGGSGDPSPTNIRPISGWDEVDVTVADDVETPTVENIYTIDLDGTRYCGEVDVINGVLKVVGVMAVLDGSSDEAWDMAQGAFLINDIFNWDSTTSATNPVCLCNMYGEVNAISSSSQVSTRSDFSFFNQTNYIDRLWVKDSRYSTVEEFKTALANNPLQVVYPLATPLTIQLTPTAVKSLLGSNNIWADTGDITDAEYFSKEV